MSLLDQIASAVGHTAETLAQATGTTVGMLESVISGLAASGIDAFWAASKLGMTVESLLRGIVARMSGDPHQQLLNRLVGPVKAMSDPLASLTSQWQYMADLHQSTARSIDQHIQELFQGNGTESYGGPAADMLWNTHQDYQRYFSTLVDHAQTQHTRHSTLSGQTDDYVSQMTSQVNGLSTPAAALALMSLDFAGPTTPTIDPQFIQGVENNAQDLQTDADNTPPGPEDPIWDILEALVVLLYIFAGICMVINWVQGIIASFQSQQKSTQVKSPPKKTQGTPPAIVNLTPEQEKMAEGLSQKYNVPLSVVEDIIRQNPGLTPEEYELLVQYYKKYGTYPYGILAAFTGVDQRGRTRIYYITHGDIAHYRSGHPEFDSLSDDELTALIKELLQGEPDGTTRAKDGKSQVYSYNDVDVDGKYLTVYIVISTVNVGRIVTVYAN